MRKLRGSTDTQQLTLLNDFDRLGRRDEKLVKELLAALSNFKYFRVNTRFSELREKEAIEKALGQAIYWTAFLGFKKARFVDTYKGKNLDYFLSLTREAPGLGVTEPLPPETLIKYYQNGQKRLMTTFMAYKDLLTDDRSITKKILDSFDNIHDLAHVI